MDLPYPAEQILNGSLPEEGAQALIAALGFADPPAGVRRLQHLAAQNADAQQALASLLPHLLAALAGCADPDQALINMERFASGAHASETFRQLVENPRTVEILITIFAGSQFLTEILLRDPQHLMVLTRRERLARQKKSDEFHNEAMQSMTPAGQLNSLHRYQRGEILRIGASDLLDLYDLPAVTSQLSNLADGIIRACLAYAGAQAQTDTSRFVVMAMGKLGGEELNYSSDIDLLFLCSDRAADYLRLGQHLIEALSSMTAEGFLYRVDMRLRPWGRDGALVTSLQNYLTYLNRNALLWEKQALLKARPSAGDLSLGEEALKQIGTALFGANPETVRASVHAMKQRTEEILRAKGREWGEVKLGEGSIRDVEFVVQFLQLAHAGQNPNLRERSTLRALPRLQQAGLLTPHESRVLADGYIFLRTVEHYLQMMHYRQTYTLPAEPNAINLLARRLGFRGRAEGFLEPKAIQASADASPEQAREHFLERYHQHSRAIRAIYSKYVGGVQTAPTSEIALVEPAPAIAIQQHLARMEASYSTTFSEEEIRRHAMLAEQLNDEQPVSVDVQPIGEASWRVTVVAYDCLGELSLICGLMFVYGLDIQDGQVFTYEAEQRSEAESTARYRPRRAHSGRLLKPTADERSQSTSARRKIVDVFTVKSVNSAAPVSDRYSEELRSLVKMMQATKRREARSELAKRVGAVFQDMRSVDVPLYPIKILIDNETSECYTVLHMQTINTVGFLYEFTNPPSMTHPYISSLVVESSGKHAKDLLYVTDENGRTITSPGKQRAMRIVVVMINHLLHQ